MWSGLGGGGQKTEVTRVELLKPKYVLALQHRDEISHLLGAVRGRRDTEIVDLPALPGVRRRSRWERRRLRQQRFSRHFSGAVRQEIRVALERTFLGTGRRLPPGTRGQLSRILGGCVLHAERTPEGLCLVVDEDCDLGKVRDLREVTGRAVVLRHGDLSSLLVDLSDAEGEFLDVGILERLDFEHWSARLLALEDAVAKVAQISLGRFRVGPNGSELGFSRAVTFV
ncbi:MAG: Clp1/GlmU family protein [Bacillota bacterium]